MSDFDIVVLNHKDQAVSQSIHYILQRAYGVEAELIGADDFPPLRRTQQDLQKATTEFFGYTEADRITGVVEVEQIPKGICIASLAVDPSGFGKGIATCLLAFVLDRPGWGEAIVETSADNAPAISLYQKLGFYQHGFRQTEDGFSLVSMRRSPEKFT